MLILFMRIMKLSNAVVIKMRTVAEYNTVEVSRLAFIETLSAEFTSRTGVGVYVFLTPVTINSLFRHYLMHSQSIAIFVKQYVRDYSNEHNI
ncbi:MAG: hypothetical protein methR_P2477 [Methyloprofundus sp.]|nr:MAG: hypothetical protein methR_P2477 [Methyloprofundus sp.]